MLKAIVGRTYKHKERNDVAFDVEDVWIAGGFVKIKIVYHRPRGKMNSLIIAWKDWPHFNKNFELADKA